jgi:Fe-S cluster assembly iron-binding protein IscA
MHATRRWLTFSGGAARSGLTASYTKEESMRNRFERTVGASIAALAVGLFSTGAAQAQDVFDTVASIVDAKDADAEATLENSGNSANVTVEKICIEGGDSVIISSFSPHPDSTQAKQKLKAKVSQSQAGNEPPIFVEGTGTMTFDVELTCEKSQIKADADLDKGKGRFDLKGKKCTGLTEDQVIYVQDVCQTAKNTKVKGKGSDLKKIQVKGKGTAEEALL